MATEDERRERILCALREMEQYRLLHEHPIERFKRECERNMYEDYMSEKQKYERFGKLRFIII